MSTNTTSVGNGGNFLRIAVLVLGVAVCLLLFFADKTNLNNQTNSALARSEVAAVNRSSSLPPLAPDPQFDGWVSALEGTEGQTRVSLLDSITGLLMARGRYAYAADYAAQLAETEATVSNRLQAGKLSQMATQLEFVAQDSALFRKYSNQSIGFLSEVVQEEPENEEALLYLGLAFTQSGLAQNSMQGILTLRKVLDLNPDHVEAGYYLGMFSLQTGQNEKAVERLEKVLENAPDYNPAKFQLAVAYSRMNKAGDARLLLEDIIRGKDADTDLKLSARELLNSLP